jgi:predicted DNA-binding transcriptional regulator AlpA
MPKPLTSWKEIAQYTGKGVRTLQRWEQDFGFPIRRPTAANGHHAIVAIPDEIDAWMQRQHGIEQTELARLRAQVRWLQSELKTYRERQSIHAVPEKSIAV